MSNKLSEQDKYRIKCYAELATKELKRGNNLDNLKDPITKINDIDNTIILIRFPSKSESLSGFSLKIDNYRCMYINSNHTLGRQYCSFWHEYYHIINDMRDKLYINIEDCDSMEELEANQFAYYMLLPDIEVKNYIIRLRKEYYNLDENDLIRIQHEFRVSLQNLIYRLNEIYKTEYFFKFIRLTSRDNREEFEQKVLSLGFNLELISPTKDFCIPKKFFKDLHSNLENHRISMDKVETILNLIEEKGVETKW